MDIDNPSATAGLSWDEPNTVIYKSDDMSYVDPLEFLGSDDSTLPVELTSFNAIYQNNDSYERILVQWRTETETLVQGFNIYRSEQPDLATAGSHINYSLIPGNGTSPDPHEYSFNDDGANIMIPHYYWLEVVDFGGTNNFQGPVTYTPGDVTGDNTIDFINITNLEGVYPNPVHNTATIHYQLKGSVLHQDVTIKIYNILGEQVKTVKGQNGKAVVDVSDLGTGIYFYRLKTDNFNSVKKMIVVK